MVARFGGDEFAILQPRITRIDDADRLAARLMDELRKPFLINGELVYATGSIGIAISPKHGNDPDMLQKNADLALYAAKADGKRTYRFFESAMDERLVNRHILERDLRRAIAADELELYYQPIVDLRTMRMTGLEALLRWTHPVHGVVPPSTFIPVAEDAGLINEIGRWVLMQACADAARWPSHLRVAVNLSVAQFTQGDIVEDIRAALSRAGLRPERLTVEITESLLLTESIATLDTLAPPEGARRRDRDGRFRHRLFVAELSAEISPSTGSRSTATSSAARATARRTPRSSRRSCSSGSRSA